jgi:hypothetical protein
MERQKKKVHMNLTERDVDCDDNSDGNDFALNKKVKEKINVVTILTC